MAREPVRGAPRSVAKREKGKVYFDHLQIGEGKTISAPYVLRAYDGAPVSTPLEWSEVRPGLSPQQFHIGNALERFARVGDLFEGVLKKRQRIEAVEKLESSSRPDANQARARLTAFTGSESSLADGL
jgi:bifunctional non-homologous end joining protein LigD